MQKLSSVTIYRLALTAFAALAIFMFFYGYAIQYKSYYPIGLFHDGCYQSGIGGPLIGLPIALLVFSLGKKYYGSWIVRVLFGVFAIIFFCATSAIFCNLYLGGTYNCGVPIIGANPSFTVIADYWLKALFPILPLIAMLMILVKEFLYRKKVPTRETSVLAWAGLILLLTAIVIPVYLITHYQNFITSILGRNLLY